MPPLLIRPLLWLLERIQARYWDRAIAGDKDALDIVLRATDLRANLLGIR